MITFSLVLGVGMINISNGEGITIPGLLIISAFAFDAFVLCWCAVQYRIYKTTLVRMKGAQIK